MTKRLQSLARISAVQTKLIALADMRLAAAERACRDLADDQMRLRDFVGTHESLGQPLAKAALHAAKELDRRLTHADQLRARQKEYCDRLTRRDHAVGAMLGAERTRARRADEDRDLRETMEAWFARQDASLP